MRSFVFVIVSSFSVATCGAPPTAATLLEAWQQRRNAVENLFVDVKWEEFSADRLVAVQNETIHSDSFGRLRVCANGGSPDSPPRETIELYNGEITVNVDEDFNRTRLGELRNAESTCLDGQYLVAIINNGLGPDKRGPFSRRNPYIFVDEGPMRTLDKVVKRNDAVSISSVVGEDSQYEVEYEPSAEDDSRQLRHRVVVDESKDWAVTTYELRSPKTSELVGRFTQTLEQNADGIWVPQSGVWQNWMTPTSTGPPDVEWRFRIHKLELNDPEFDSDVFEPKLKPGTYVSDNRHRVVYTVGGQTAIASDLEDLAHQALVQLSEKRRSLAKARLI